MAEQIGNPNVPASDDARQILEIAETGFRRKAKNLVKLLARNNRLSTLPEIARLFETSRPSTRVRQVQVARPIA